MAEKNELLEFKLVYLDEKIGEEGAEFKQSFYAKDINDAQRVGKDLFRRMQESVRSSDKTYTFIEIRPA